MSLECDYVQYGKHYADYSLIYWGSYQNILFSDSLFESLRIGGHNSVSQFRNLYGPVCVIQQWISNTYALCKVDW